MANRWRQEVLLHYHGDGAKALIPVLPELFEMSCRPYPFGKTGNDWEEVKAVFRNPKIDIVERFSNTTGVMQSRETLALAAESWVRELAEEGYKYAEVTVAPQYHVPLRGFKNFSELLKNNDPQRVKEEIKNAVSAMIEGIKRGEAKYPGIEVNLLIAVGREVSAKTAMFLVEAAAECDRNYAVGIGLVCDEAAHPPEKHIPMFLRAKKFGFKTTAHAGEWVNVYPAKPDPERDRGKLIENIQTAIIGLGVDRIGHAIPLAQSGPLIELVVERDIGIELCPGSNFASGLIPNMKYLRIRDLLKAGVLCSINPDDDLFLPDMNETFRLLQAEYDFKDEELKRFNANAWKTRFGRRKLFCVVPR